MRSITFILLSFLTIFFSGCATIAKFHAIPIQPTDFQHSLDEMSIQYPDIKTFEKKFRGVFPDTPTIDDLIDYWGQPNKVETQWIYFGEMGVVLVGSGAIWGVGPTAIAGGIAFGIRPFPPEYYYWIKEKYCIEAVTDRILMTDSPYKRRMVYWKWYEFEGNVSSLPEGCTSNKAKESVSAGVK